MSVVTNANSLNDTLAKDRFEDWLLAHKRMSWKEYQRKPGRVQDALVREWIGGGPAALHVADAMIRDAYERYAGAELCPAPWLQPEDVGLPSVPFVAPPEKQEDELTERQMPQVSGRLSVTGERGRRRMITALCSTFWLVAGVTGVLFLHCIVAGVIGFARYFCHDAHQIWLLGMRLAGR